MIHLLLPLSVAVEGITLLAAASAGIHLTPGLYVGKATEVTKACWPGMARIHLLFEPPTVAGRASTLSITQENGRNHYIASGKALAYPTSVFMTDWGSGTGFFINSTHIYPGRKRKPLPLPARIPFYTEDGNLTAFLDAREDENGRVYHVNCPVHLNKITSFISISPVRPKASAETKNGDMVEEVSSRDQKPVVGASRAAAKTQEKAVVDGVVMDDKREIGSGSGSASETGGRDMVNGERQVASGFDAASKEGELVVENVMMLEERGPTSGSSSASEVDAGEVVEDAVVQENAVARGSSPGCPTLEPSPAAARLYSQTRLIPFVKQGATGSEVSSP
ncbi:hypothetical protein FOZ62_008818 [Perkinsus olseni]|uniref:Uncharacterized protein n=1 Tax=Perkinsus olseni TaxID=32597 RepID=A0A7J6SX47_PEROL|nr:hypothetical protein FOZ62_008818 [Perkinsus olseni]